MNENAFERFLKSSATEPLSFEVKVGTRLMQFEHRLQAERNLVHVYGTETAAQHELQERLREADALQRTFVDGALDAILFLDAKGVLTDCNPAAERLFGYRRSELAGKHLNKLRLFSQRQVSQLTRSTGGRSSGPDEFDVARKDGRRLSVVVSRAQARRNGKPEILVTVRDASERKRSSEDLARCRAELERLTAEHANLSKRARPAGPDVSQAVAQLTSRLNHDLRNSLGTIRNSVYYLDMALGANPDARLRDHRRIITAAIDRAVKSLAEIQDSVTASADARTRCEVAALIDQALGSTPIPDNVKLEKAVGDRLPAIEANSRRVSRVLSSIVRNALEAMPAGGTLRIDAAGSAGEVVISVADTGSGISAQNQARVFEPFFSTRPGGVGLGLLQARETVAADSGSIEFESEEGRGTTFRLRFPANAERRPAADSDRGPGAKSGDRPQESRPGDVRET